MSRSRQTDLLKLYARQAKLKRQIYLQTIKRICHRDSSKCLSEKKNDEGFVYVIFDTTNPQNRALHDVLHILHTGRLCFPALSPRQFEVSRLITLHSRRGENKPIYI